MITVYDDARCAFCQWARSVIQSRDTLGRIQFCDYDDASVRAQTPFSFEAFNRRMHLRTADGVWHEGFFAWVEVLKAVPGWRWIGRILGAPPVRWIGPALYWVLARNRYRIPRFVLRWLGAPEPCGVECAVPVAKS